MTANRRPGVTLIEVLMATGILAVGLLAILALFPIGAVNMARAITQDRSSTHAANADAVFRVYWKQAWVDSAQGGIRGTNEEAYLASNEPMLLLLEAHPYAGPIAGQNAATPGFNAQPGLTTQPSFPVLVDPIGWQTNAADPVGMRQFVAGNPGLPCRTTFRRNIALVPTLFTRQVPPLVPTAPAPPPYFPPPNYPSDAQSAVRLTTLLDDMTFDNAGEPANLTGQLERAGRYSAAWLIQRPNNSVPTDLHMTVLLYAGRSPTDTPSAELSFPAQIPGYADPANPPQTMLVNYGTNQAKPGLRKGGFVAFSVELRPDGIGGTPYPTLDFYRIGGVNDDTNGVLILDLERPVKGYKLTSLAAKAGQYDATNFNLNGTAIWFDNLVEVFDRGTVSAAGVSGR